MMLLLATQCRDNGARFLATVMTINGNTLSHFKGLIAATMGRYLFVDPKLGKAWVVFVAPTPIVA